MLNQLVNFHSYYNPFRLHTSQHRPVQLLLVSYISVVITQARFLPGPYTTMHPLTLHVITRAQFLSPISISTPYPAPQRFTRLLRLGFLTVYIAPHLPTQAWPIKVTHSISLSPGGRMEACVPAAPPAQVRIIPPSHLSQATFTKFHDIVITKVPLNISTITNDSRLSI